jgi:hypothetical protein
MSEFKKGGTDTVVVLTINYQVTFKAEGKKNIGRI